MENDLKNFSEVDIKEIATTRNGKKYLTWTKASAIFTKKYPDWSFDITRWGDKLITGDSDTGYLVETTIDIPHRSISMCMPVTPKNASSKITSKEIDKAIMQCLVKNMALFGLGIELYENSDLPDEIKTKEQLLQELKELMATHKITEEMLTSGLVDNFKKNKISELDASEIERLIATIQFKKAKNNTTKKFENKEATNETTSESDTQQAKAD